MRWAPRPVCPSAHGLATAPARRPGGCGCPHEPGPRDRNGPRALPRQGGGSAAPRFPQATGCWAVPGRRAASKLPWVGRGGAGVPGPPPSIYVVTPGRCGRSPWTVCSCSPRWPGAPAVCSYAPVWRGPAGRGAGAGARRGWTLGSSQGTCSERKWRPAVSATGAQASA